MTKSEIEALLDVAAYAARTSGVRLNAPLVCSLLGRMGASRGASVSELARAADRTYLTTNVLPPRSAP